MQNSRTYFHPKIFKRIQCGWISIQEDKTHKILRSPLTIDRCTVSADIKRKSQINFVFIIDRLRDVKDPVALESCEYN